MNNPDSKKIAVGRFINGVTLNGLEYLLDDDGKVKEFNSENEAKIFLKQNGVSAKYLDGFVYEETDRDNAQSQNSVKKTALSKPGEENKKIINDEGGIGR